MTRPWLVLMLLEREVAIVDAVDLAVRRGRATRLCRTDFVLLLAFGLTACPVYGRGPKVDGEVVAKRIRDLARAHANRKDLLDASAFAGLVETRPDCRAIWRNGTAGDKRAVVRALHDYVQTVTNDVRDRVDRHYNIPAGRRFDRRTTDIPAELREWYYRYQRALFVSRNRVRELADPADLPLALATVQMIAKAPAHLRVPEFEARLRYQPEHHSPHLRAVQAAMALPTRAERIERLKTLVKSAPESSHAAAIALGRCGREAVPFLIDHRSWAGLRELGPAVVPDMMKLLGGKDPKRIVLAAQVLAPSGHRPAIERAADALVAATDAKVGFALAEAIVYLGPDAADALLRKMKRRGALRPKTYAAAARAFFRLKHVEAIPLLKEALRKPENWIDLVPYALESLRAEKLRRTLPPGRFVDQIAYLAKVHKNRKERLDASVFVVLGGPGLGKGATAEQKRARVRALHAYAKTVIDDLRDRVDRHYKMAPGYRYERFRTAGTEKLPRGLRRYHQLCQQSLYDCLGRLMSLAEPEDIPTIEMIGAAPAHVPSMGDLFSAPLAERARSIVWRLKATQAMRQALALPTRRERIERLKSLARTREERLRECLRPMALAAMVEHGEEMIPFFIETRSRWALLQLGHTASPAMVELLKSKDPREVELATTVLREGGQRAAIPQLVDAFLLAGDAGARGTLMVTLEAFGRDAAIALAMRLKGGGQVGRVGWTNAAELFRRMKFTAAIPVLERAPAQFVAPGGPIDRALRALKREAEL